MQTSNKELILLVDDDPGNLKRAQTILGEEFRISATTVADPFGCKYAGNERI